MTPRLAFAFLPLVLGLASGCSEVPPLDPEMSAAARAAEYPALVPIEQVTGRAPADRIAVGDTDELEARGARLRARAARLRAAVQQ